MKQLLLAFALFSLFSLSFHAFSKPLELSTCNGVGAKIDNILFGQENQMSFYEGSVGLVIYKTTDPTTAPLGIAIIHNEIQENSEDTLSRKCLAIPFLSGVNFKKAKTTSDAATGIITVIVDVRITDGFAGATRESKIAIYIERKLRGTFNTGHVVTAEEL